MSTFATLSGAPAHAHTHAPTAKRLLRCPRCPRRKYRTARDLALHILTTHGQLRFEGHPLASAAAEAVAVAAASSKQPGRWHPSAPADVESITLSSPDLLGLSDYEGEHDAHEFIDENNSSPQHMQRKLALRAGEAATRDTRRPRTAASLLRRTAAHSQQDASSQPPPPCHSAYTTRPRLKQGTCFSEESTSHVSNGEGEQLCPDPSSWSEERYPPYTAAARQRPIIESSTSSSTSSWSTSSPASPRITLPLARSSEPQLQSRRVIGKSVCTRRDACTGPRRHPKLARQNLVVARKPTEEHILLDFANPVLY